MIKTVSANQSSFKTVEFSDGLNVVWADRTKDSTKRDSRNGLGKSTLIEIIHFCLGAKATRNKGLLVEPLAGWEFTVDLELAGKAIRVSRGVDSPNVIIIDGDISNWPIRPKIKDGRASYGNKDWNALLGHLLFGLGIEEEGGSYQPKYRSLVSYFIRRGKDAFSTPFEHHRKQVEWDKQVHNAFLLGLAWEDAAEMQVLRDRKKGIESLHKAAKAGVVKGFFGSLGDLEARKVRLKSQAEQEAESLRTFNVHPEYERIRVDANRLTEEIHTLVNANAVDQRALGLYETSLVDENAPIPDVVERIYREAGVDLPGVTLRRLGEVQEFHNKIIENRRSFLSTEIGRLKREIAARDDLARQKTTERADALRILQTHGALEEYTLLQTRHLTIVNELNSISSAIENLKACETGLSEVKIAQEVLHQKARRDYEERSAIWEKAITLFNAYSQRLYNAPGKLVIDVGTGGFKFDVEIERSGSAGISNMKVFCYDLVLARLWAERLPSPRLLVHDSTIFDGVDERQRALALEIAASESKQFGFQYICTLNSDYVPWNEFSRGFDLQTYIKLTLTDADETGCLLGIRF